MGRTRSAIVPENSSRFVSPILQENVNEGEGTWSQQL